MVDYMAFLNARNTLLSKAIERATQFQELVAPFIEQWVAKRPHVEPLTGKPMFVFECHIDHLTTGVAEIRLEVFDGSMLTFTVDRENDAIVIASTITNGTASRDVFTKIAMLQAYPPVLNVWKETRPDPSINGTGSVGTPLETILEVFERNVFSDARKRLSKRKVTS